jgi:hypothetical protein
VRFTEKSLYIFPKMNWKAQEQRRKAEEYQPTSAEVWKSLVMLYYQQLVPFSTAFC